MQEKEARITIYDESGKPVDSKRRADVNKRKDILKTVNIVLTNNKSEVYIILADSSIWPGKWGGSCAGLVRKNETSEEAADRTLLRELGVEINLSKVYEGFENFDGVKRIFSVFYSRIDSEINPNHEDILQGKWVQFDDLRNMIARGECMPTLEFAFFKIQKNNLF